MKCVPDESEVCSKTISAGTLVLLQKNEIFNPEWQRGHWTSIGMCIKTGLFRVKVGVVWRTSEDQISLWIGSTVSKVSFVVIVLPFPWSHKRRRLEEQCKSLWSLQKNVNLSVETVIQNPTYRSWEQEQIVTGWREGSKDWRKTWIVHKIQLEEMWMYCTFDSIQCSVGIEIAVSLNFQY